MSPAKAHKALFVVLLGIGTGCGDPGPDSTVVIGPHTANVVGGWAASDAQIFATVELRRSGSHSGFCSGVLISPRVVVTAAHCTVIEDVEAKKVLPTQPNSLWVAAGHLTSSGASQTNMRSVIDVRVHEAYDHDFIMGRSREGAGQGGIGSPNDIAVLILSTPFEEIVPASLLTPARQDELVRHGDVAYVAGYGVYDFEDRESGQLFISDAIVDIIGERELLTRRGDSLGDSCVGDSGGPLYVPTEEGDFLVGLVSRGRSDVERDCGDGGVYTMLSAHLDWVAEAAGASFVPRWQASDGSSAFTPEGVDEVVARKGGHLHGKGSCSAAPPGSRDRSFATAVIALAVLVWSSRRLSRGTA